VAQHGITVNSVCPGPTDTALLGQVAAYSQKLRDGLARAIPLRRVGQPADVAGAVAFLASDEAAFITGQTLSVSGGLTMA
jgi:2-hydroxycyclohexanecarboxyl-CoA dehydrogenase